MYAGPIIDPHHHLWDLSLGKHPWLPPSDPSVQADAVFDLGATFPELQIVINHCGSPIDRDPEGMDRWRKALEKIAALPNVAIKVSNPGACDPHWTLDSIRDVAMHCIDCFGMDRAMFGTDCPVSRIQMSFDEIYDTYKAIAEPMGEAGQTKLLYGNAKRFYRI